MEFIYRHLHDVPRQQQCKKIRLNTTGGAHENARHPYESPWAISMKTYWCQHSCLAVWCTIKWQCREITENMFTRNCRARGKSWAHPRSWKHCWRLSRHFLRKHDNIAIQSNFLTQVRVTEYTNLSRHFGARYSTSHTTGAKSIRQTPISYKKKTATTGTYNLM